MTKLTLKQINNQPLDEVTTLPEEIEFALSTTMDQVQLDILEWLRNFKAELQRHES